MSNDAGKSLAGRMSDAERKQYVKRARRVSATRHGLDECEHGHLTCAASFGGACVAEVRDYLESSSGSQSD